MSKFRRKHHAKQNIDSKGGKSVYREQNAEYCVICRQHKVLGLLLKSVLDVTTMHSDICQKTM